MLKSPASDAVSLLLLSALSAVHLLLRGSIPFRSDQAVVFLMALDILRGIAHPVFYYGVAYGGTLEPHLLALFAAAFGASRLVYFLFTITLLLLLILVIWRFTFVAFGRRAALFAGLLLAFGPHYFFRRGLTSDGAYLSLAFLLACVLLSLFHLGTSSQSIPGPSPHWAALTGFLTGLAWWVMPIAASVAGPLLLVALRGRARLLRTPRTLLLLSVTFFAGSAPWWVWNVRHQWQSLTQHEMRTADAGDFKGNLESFVAKGIPVLSGGSWMWQGVETFPGARLLSVAFVLLVLAVAVSRVTRELGTDRRLAFALLLTFLAGLVLLALAMKRTNFHEPRYLYPAYAGFAPLVGVFFDMLMSRRLVFAVATVAVVTMNVTNQLRAPRLWDCEEGTRHNPYRQVEWLRARHANRLYASYWTAYRVIFFAGESIIATPYGVGNNQVTRLPRYRDLVDADPRPGFLLEGEDARRFSRFLERSSVPHHQETLEGFTLFTDLPSSTIAMIRRCNCIPFVPTPGDVRWGEILGPRRLSAGQTASYRVAFENGSPFDFHENIHLGFRWRRLGGSTPLLDAGRVIPAAYTSPGQTTFLSFDVKAPLEPGSHQLVVDLVDENVEWFEDRGVSPISCVVDVEP